MTPEEQIIARVNDRIIESDSIGMKNVIVDFDEDGNLIFALNEVNKYDISSELIDDKTYVVSGHPIELVINLFGETRIETAPVQMDLYDSSQFLREWRNNSSPEDCPSFSLAHVEAIERCGGIGKKHEIKSKQIQKAFQEYYKLEPNIPESECLFH